MDSQDTPEITTLILRDGDPEDLDAALAPGGGGSNALKITYSGPLLRLVAATRSLAARRDANVCLHRAPGGRTEDGDQLVQVTIWSPGGTWSTRAWYFSGQFGLEAGEYDEVFVYSHEPLTAQAVVGSPRGETTRFVGGDSPRQEVSHWISHKIQQAWEKWEVRRTQRELAGARPTGEPERAPSVGEFLALVAEQRAPGNAPR